MNEVTHYADLIARELQRDYQHVRNTLSLLSEGATIPFIARYRKEKTGSMDEVIIAEIQKRWQQLMALDKRREVILQSVEEQGMLTDALRASFMEADSMQELEDLALVPFLVAFHQTLPKSSSSRMISSSPK